MIPAAYVFATQTNAYPKVLGGERKAVASQLHSKLFRFQNRINKFPRLLQRLIRRRMCRFVRLADEAVVYVGDDDQLSLDAFGFDRDQMSHKKKP